MQADGSSSKLQTVSGQQAQAKSKSRALANVNAEILNKVEGMIATKKQPEKVFNNNPPKREVVQNQPAENNQAKVQNWNSHFTKESLRKVPGQDHMINHSPDRGQRIQDQTLNSSALVHDTGVERMIMY